MRSSSTAMPRTLAIASLPKCLTGEPKAVRSEARVRDVSGLPALAQAIVGPVDEAGTAQADAVCGGECVTKLTLHYGELAAKGHASVSMCDCDCWTAHNQGVPGGGRTAACATENEEHKEDDNMNACTEHPSFVVRCTYVAGSYTPPTSTTMSSVLSVSVSRVRTIPV